MYSRELGEQLYGTFNVDDYEEFHMFNGDSVRYGVMTRNLELLKCDGNVESLGSVDFIDHSLPFSQYLPTCEDLSRRVDMIFGCEFVWRYLFRLAKKHVDSETMPNGINNALEFDLGQFWLSSETQLDSIVSNLVANSVADLEEKRHVEQIPPRVKADCTHFGTTSKVRLLPQDRESDLERLKQDLLYTSPNDNKLTMSRVDEAVLRNYEENVQLVTLSDGKSHLQFSLPWSRDPAIMKDNYSRARDVLLRLKNRLNSRPELRSKYCDKIETAIAEGHILRVPDEVLREEKGDTSKPRYYIPHFNTSQSKFRVVYDAAREHHGISLNKMLERGPIFMQSLKAILLRFGEKRYGVAGDIL